MTEIRIPSFPSDGKNVQATPVVKLDASPWQWKSVLKIFQPDMTFLLQHSWHELKQGERNGVFWCVSLSWSQNIDPLFGGQRERASGMQAAFAVLVGAPLAAAVPSVLLLLPRFSRMHFTHDPFFGDSVLTFYFCVFFLTHSNWLNHRAHTPAHRVIVINV